MNRDEELARLIVKHCGGLFVPLHCFELDTKIKDNVFDSYNKERNRQITKYTNEAHAKERTLMIQRANLILKELNA